MAGQERHISARPQPCASTVEQSATRIELFDSFSEHHQQQQRQKSQGQQQQVQKQEQQHEQKASDAAQIRASMAEQELKKSGVADMGRMLLEADSHIVRLTAQLEEHRSELAAAREQLLMAAHWLQKAADQLDAGKVAATAQQEQYKDLLQRHQDVLQQLELLADRGADALDLLTAEVPESLQAMQLTTDSISGVYLAMDVLKRLLTLQLSGCQSPRSTLTSVQSTPRSFGHTSPQRTPRPYGHSSPRPYSYSRLSSAQPSPRSTAPASCTVTACRPRLPSLATAVAAKLMHRAMSEGQQVPETQEAVSGTSEAGSIQLRLSPHPVCGFGSDLLGSESPSQHKQRLLGRPAVPPLATAVAAAVAAAELAAGEAEQSACATDNSSRNSTALGSTPGGRMAVQPLQHSSSLGLPRAAQENSASMPCETYSVGGRDTSGMGMVPKRVTDPAASTGAVAPAAGPHVGRIAGMGVSADRQFTAGNKAGVQAASGCTGADSLRNDSSSSSWLRRRQPTKAGGSCTWGLISKRDKTAFTPPVTGQTRSVGNKQLFTAMAAVVLVVICAVWFI